MSTSQASVMTQEVVFSQNVIDKGIDEAIRVVIPAREEVGRTRKFGCVEKYQATLHELDFLRSIVLACRYRLPDDLKSPARRRDLINTFEQVVASVVLTHPLLAAGVEDENTLEPRWVRLSTLDMRDHISWHTLPRSSRDYQSVVRYATQLELDFPFLKTRDRPAWRIKVLHQEGASTIDVLFVHSHIVCDAGSAHLIHKDILQGLHEGRGVCGDAILDKGILTLPKLAMWQLSPPPEALVDFPIDMVANSAEDAPALDLRTQARWAPILPAPFNTDFRTIELSDHATSDLVWVCRQHRVTVTSLVHAIVLVSLAPLLDPSDAGGMSSMTAMDIRRFLPSGHSQFPLFDSSRAVGNYVTILDHVFDETTVSLARLLPAIQNIMGGSVDPGTALIWSVAKGVGQNIKDKLARGLHNDMIGFARSVQDWSSALKTEALKPRGPAFVVTNLGVIDGNPIRSAKGSSWSISHAQFTMSANVVAAAFGIAIATVQAGGLSLTCSWQDNAIDSTLAERFMANMARWLDVIASTRARACFDTNRISHT